MFRKTSSIAIAITVAVASLGATSPSPAGASDVLRVNIIEVQGTTPLYSTQTAKKDKLSCTPIPFWPWCI